MSRLWLAGGSNVDSTVTLVKSPDTLTWEAVPNPIDGGAVVFAAQGNYRTLIGGNGPETLAVSTDGTGSWTAVASDITKPTASPLGAAYSPTLRRWVLVGVAGTGNAKFATSDDDGLTWTVRATDFDDQGNPTCVVWIAELGLFVCGVNLYLGVITAAGCIGTSPDGINWTPRATPFGTGTFSIVRALAWDGTTLVAAGGSNGGTATLIAASSADATTWAPLSTPLDDAGGNFGASGVGYEPTLGLWTLVANQTDAPVPIATSPDLSTWATPTPAFDSGLGVGGADGLILIAGYDNLGPAPEVIESTGDGAAWSAIPSPLDGGFYGAFVGAFDDTPAPPPPGPAPLPALAARPLGKYVLRIFDKVTKLPAADVVLRNTDPRSGTVVDEASRELNAGGEMTFSFPTLDPHYLKFGADGLEGCPVQLWRKDKCWWYGLVTGAHAEAPGLSRARAELADWLFSGLHFGPITTNYLPNPNFSTGVLTPWSAVNCDSAAFDPSVVIRTSPGGTPGSARLTKASAGQDSYIQNVFAIPYHADQDLTFTVAGWYRLDPAVAFDGPAYLERGLYVALINAGNVFVHGAHDILNKRALGRGWPPARQQTRIVNPAGNAGASLDVRCMCPGTAINWGGLSVTVEESVTASVDAVDVKLILQAIVQYSQGTFPDLADKIDMGITFGHPDGSPNDDVGTVLARTYQLFDLGSVKDAIDEFPQMGVCDYGVTWDPDNPTGWYFQLFPGGRGTSKLNLALVLGRHGARLLRGYSHDSDAGRSSNEAVVLGQGSAGSDREFGVDRDMTRLPWALRQHVASAPSDAELDTLDSRARRTRLLLDHPVHVPSLTVGGDLSEQLEEGDTIPVVVDYGYAQLTGTQRVQKMTLRPQTDDLVIEVAQPST